MKYRVIATVKRGNRNYGVCTTVRMSVDNIRSVLEETFGNGNVLMCNIKEIQQRSGE